MRAWADFRPSADIFHSCFHGPANIIGTNTLILELFSLVIGMFKLIDWLTD